MYKAIIRPLFFLIDPERVHHLAFSLLKISLSIPIVPNIVRNQYLRKAPKEVFGLTFRNPVGLAAGFDKDAKLLKHWEKLGFGFIEIGTVTPRPQVGNPKKRLFRLPMDQAVINRMGFNNKGLDHMVQNLKKYKKTDLIVGANIGKNKDTPNEQAVDDYLICFKKLFDYVDYFVVNVSSPNTPGLRSLQEKGPLTHLLNTLQQTNQEKDSPKPLLLKIAPDLTEGQLDDIIGVVKETKLAGLIVNNTTIDRSGLKTGPREIEAIGNGGLSGAPLKARAQEILAYTFQKSKGTFPIIGVGGIMSGEDAQERVQAGASLVQVYTGFVYKGPALVREMVLALS